MKKGQKERKGKDEPADRVLRPFESEQTTSQPDSLKESKERLATLTLQITLKLPMNVSPSLPLRPTALQDLHRFSVEKLDADVDWFLGTRLHDRGEVDGRGGRGRGCGRGVVGVGEAGTPVKRGKSTRRKVSFEVETRGRENGTRQWQKSEETTVRAVGSLRSDGMGIRRSGEVRRGRGEKGRTRSEQLSERSLLDLGDRANENGDDLDVLPVNHRFVSDLISGEGRGERSNSPFEDLSNERKMHLDGVLFLVLRQRHGGETTSVSNFRDDWKIVQKKSVRAKGIEMSQTRREGGTNAQDQDREDRLESRRLSRLREHSHRGRRDGRVRE